ncbi:MAG: hypothetical protein KA821_20875 [Chitinophagaceae bacterium]|nr:hypothetical protein [Chitinophagaceae bacterium]
MFTLIASMLSSSADTARETAVFNNSDAESASRAHFLTGADVVGNSNRLYTDWLFNTCLVICAEVSLSDNQAN